jgi:enoyl-CoA hydratase
MTNVRFDIEGTIAVVTIDRPRVKNCVDQPTAAELAAAFRRFEADDALSCAILRGEGDSFCAGADLKAVSGAGAELEADAQRRANQVRLEGDGPMGPTRMELAKPVIAAVEGHAVAGGLELAVWCDLRVAAEDATFGVYCRRFGVPLVDGGTIRLTRLIGQSRALDMILTGRGVGGREAHEMGLANRLTPRGGAFDAALELANQLAKFPQRCLRADRRSVYEQWSLDLPDALRNETALGLAVIRSGETVAGAKRFVAGAGRHGSFDGSE